MRGYKENGNINTPLELAIDNQIDRFSLAIDAIDRVPGLALRAAHLKEEMKDAIIDNLHYARTHGTDREELSNWVHGDTEGRVRFHDRATAGRSNCLLAGEGMSGLWVAPICVLSVCTDPLRGVLVGRHLALALRGGERGTVAAYGWVDGLLGAQVKPGGSACWGEWFAAIRRSERCRCSSDLLSPWTGCEDGLVGAGRFAKLRLRR